jgi:drug/metabolite transporter (DMT)-like permease
MNIAMASFTLNDVFMKKVSGSLPLSEMIAVRGSLTVILLLVLARVMRVSQFRPEPQDRRMLILRTGAEVFATLTFLLALQNMPLANVSAILQVLPLAVTLAAAVLLREKVGWRRMTAIGVGFCGVLLIVKPGTEGFNIWSVLALISVCFVVVRDLSTRRFSKGLPSITIVLYAASAVTVMGYAGLTLEPWQPLRREEALLLSGAAGMLILGYLFIVKAMRVGDVAIVAPFRYTALLWAILLGWLVFGTLPNSVTLLGAGIVVATGLFTYLREYQLNRKTTL